MTPDFVRASGREMQRHELPSPVQLAEVAGKLEQSSPEEILGWALATYGARAAIATSFGGPTTMAILHMATQLSSVLTVYYLDTGLLFPETHALVEAVRERYGIDPIAVKPELSLEEQSEIAGPNLWERDPDLCCTVRKIVPQRGFLRNYDAWVTGLRRDQAETRSAVPVVEWDEQFQIGKVNPLARWSEGEVWEYLDRHDVPRNELHAAGYPSLGCQPCTQAVATGQPLRAGRWAGTGKIECGLHVLDKTP